MSLTFSADLFEDLPAPLKNRCKEVQVGNRTTDTEFLLPVSGISDAALKLFLDLAREQAQTKVARAIDAILQARAGRAHDTPVPNFKAFLGMLLAYLCQDRQEGWVFLEERDGQRYPALVTDIEFDSGFERYGRHHSERPCVTLTVSYFGLSRQERSAEPGYAKRRIMFYPQQVSRRTLPAIFAAADLIHENPALIEAYRSELIRFDTQLREGFAKQYVATGKILQHLEHYRLDGAPIDARRVIHDTPAALFQALGTDSSREASPLFDAHESDGEGTVPGHPVVGVFDLKTHDTYWMHANALTAHVYDRSLGEKLVLPASHRDLLDVLTSDTQVFMGDVIEGKSAGNIILCKGVPGVGKTLTAEVYAELIGKPLYKIHAGDLGTDAEKINDNLETIFQRCARWDCVLLLDEADVFVMRRGESIERNAVVAEFLRTLEYFDGLLFMTTNRPNDIDEAIISRCAAIIEYDLPSTKNLHKVWAVQSDLAQAALPNPLIDQLVALFPQITPRDIKMLLRLTLRAAQAKHQGALSLDLFRRCAMFRAIAMDENAPVDKEGCL